MARTRKPKTQYRAVTLRGKQFVASEFYHCVIGIAETLEVDQSSMRVISRSHGSSWYVYADERLMREDLAQHKMVQWVGLLTKEIS